MVADSVDYLEWKTGRRSEGVCFASQTFISKLTAGISTLITSFVLKAVDFQEPREVLDAATGLMKDVPVDQSETVLSGMFIMVTVIPMVSLALCAIPMIFNDYSGKKKEKIQKELAARRENSDVN